MPYQGPFCNRLTRQLDCMCHYCFNRGWGKSAFCPNLHREANVRAAGHRATAPVDPNWIRRLSENCFDLMLVQATLNRCAGVLSRLRTLTCKKDRRGEPTIGAAPNPLPVNQSTFVSREQLLDRGRIRTCPQKLRFYWHQNRGLCWVWRLCTFKLCCQSAKVHLKWIRVTLASWGWLLKIDAVWSPRDNSPD